MTTAIVCTCLLAGLLFALSIRTSMQRGKAEDQMPTRPDDPLFVAIRAHGNAAENIPMLCILMLLVGFGNPAWWMLALMVLVTASRFTHAIALIRTGDMAKESPLRIAGAVTTTIGGLGLAAAAVLVASQVATKVLA